MLRTRVSISVLILLLNCGSDAPSDELAELCDGTDELVLTMRFDSQHQTSILDALRSENGERFIHLNGKCEFWYWFSLSDPPISHAQDRVMTGKLTKENSSEFLNKIRWSKWGSFDQRINGDSGRRIGTYAFSSRENAFYLTLTSSIDDNELTGMMRGFDEGLEYLSKFSQPMQQDRVRVFVYPGPEDSWWEDDFTETFYVDWKYRLSVEDIAESQLLYCFGDSLLMLADDAAAFERERAEFEKFALKHPYSRIAVQGERQKYFFFLRDVLPYEDDRGLVKFGLPGPEVCFEN